MKRLLIALVKFYRKYISPLRPPCCRYYPTCSQYALEALEKYGALKGGWLALRRILRCNPFGGSGIDEVPDKFKWNCWCRDCSDQESQAYFFQSKLEKSNHGK